MAALRTQIEEFLINTVGIDDYYFKEFEFKAGTTPLSSIGFPFLTILCYCIGIPLLENFMKDRKSPPLKFLIVIHNLFLSSISLFMAIFLLSTVYSYSSPLFGQTKHGEPYTYHDILCALSHYDQKGTLSFLCYINYLLKYYELLDTVFLALKHKNISFLHGYHHPATLALTWGQLLDSTGMQWIIIWLNLCVHTVMYFYYFIMAAKLKFLRPKQWKQLVTMGQITQFIVGLIACYYVCFANRFYGICVGHVRSGIIGIGILTSYLYLFVDFFAEVYKNKTIDKRLNTILMSLFVAFLSMIIYLLGSAAHPDHPYLNKMHFN